MELVDYIILASAALLAGGLNAIAGGGTFLTFPALVFVGVPPIPANATSAVAVFPGYLSGALGFFKELKSVEVRQLLVLVVIAICGGVSGAMLLLVTPNAVFNWIVPWLLLFATLLFSFDDRIARWSKRAEGRAPQASWSPTLLVSIYGGYFNGGLGIVLLALFSASGYRDLNLMNGLKNGLSFVLSAASVMTFTLAGIVHWHEVSIMMVAAIIGGYIGARISRKLSRVVVRAVIILVGVSMTVFFFYQSIDN